jgi:hypothetical protein
MYGQYGYGAVKNLWLLVNLISTSRSVNLYKMKDFVGGILGNKETSSESHYKRLIRFINTWSKKKGFKESLLRHNVRLLRARGFDTLLLDGTSWRFGQQKVHYLVLSIVVRKVSIPIFWKQMGKIGASSQEDRIKLFEEASKLFNLRGMTLIADREYVGKEWFKYLIDNGINFVIRIKWCDFFKEVEQTKEGTYKKLTYRCAASGKFIHHPIELLGYRYEILMFRNPKKNLEDPVFLLLTNLAPTKHTANKYKTRWKIECMFKHLKSNGYHLEDINLRDEGKAEFMLALVATSFVLAIREGIQKIKQIVIKQYKDGSRIPAVSIFRKGLAILTTICTNFESFLDHILYLLRGDTCSFLKNVQ